MDVPGFNAESSLGLTKKNYRSSAVAGRSGTAEVVPISMQALPAGLVSHRKPDGLILSTGNLYFTSVDIVNTHRNLVTDGANLYGQDDSTTRKMPIHGGAVTVLDQASLNSDRKHSFAEWEHHLRFRGRYSLRTNGRRYHTSAR